MGKSRSGGGYGCGRRHKGFGDRRCGRAVAVRIAAQEDAQSTLEYALAVLALLGLIAGCAAVWAAGRDGAFSLPAEQATSHTLGALGALDITLY